VTLPEGTPVPTANGLVCWRYLDYIGLYRRPHPLDPAGQGWSARHTARYAELADATPEEAADCTRELAEMFKRDALAHGVRNPADFEKAYDFTRTAMGLPSARPPVAPATPLSPVAALGGEQSPLHRSYLEPGRLIAALAPRRLAGR
jgi:hypothetical protein